MDGVGWIVVLLIAAGLAGIVRLVARGPEIIGDMWYAPPMGWPPGVQEDDDLQWRWPRDGVGSPPGAPSRPGAMEGRAAILTR